MWRSLPISHSIVVKDDVKSFTAQDAKTQRKANSLTTKGAKSRREHIHWTDPGLNGAAPTFCFDSDDMTISSFPGALRGKAVDLLRVLCGATRPTTAAPTGSPA